MMRWQLKTCVVLCWLGRVHAADLTDQAAEVSDLRNQIQQQRSLIESTFTQAQQACWQRFAVTDCERAAKQQRRAALDLLRQKELAVNAQERSTNAAAALQRIEQNSADKRLQLDLQVQQSLRETQTRLQRSAEKASAVTKRMAAPQTASPQPAVLPDQAAVAQHQRDFEAKVQEAQQHKADKLKQLAREPGTSTKSLPRPADQ